uniref:Uncharacterized protein n=1 Tax=Panagrolaimus sp. ES5 TaxID=591445 RepID=A0AC34G381_9BILA
MESDSDNDSIPSSAASVQNAASQNDMILKRYGKLERKYGVLKKLCEKRGYKIYRQGLTIHGLITDGQKESIKSKVVTVEQAIVKGAIDYAKLDQKILMVHVLEHRNNTWFADSYQINLRHPSLQLCVFGHLDVNGCQNLNDITSRVCWSNLKEISLIGLKLTYKDYMKWAKLPYLQLVRFHSLAVKNENGKDLDIADVLKELSNVETILYHCNFNEILKPDVMKKLVQLSLPNLKRFSLFGINPGFDLEAFGEVIEKNPKVNYFNLTFAGSNEFYDQITQAEETLRLKLPKTTELCIRREN